MNVDGNKPESVVNLTGNRNGVLAAAWACFAVGAAWLWSLVTGAVRAPSHASTHCPVSPVCLGSMSCLTPGKNCARVADVVVLKVAHAQEYVTV